MSAEPLLRLRGVTKHFQQVRAVDGIDLDLYPGETLGIVGESGCGKSTLARLIARLLPVSAGRIEFDGRDVTRYSGRPLRELRRDIQMVFQDPYSSLNPRKRVGEIIGAPFEIHRLASGAERRRRVRELMELVGLSPEHEHRYPYEFSGGQRQRIGLARSLALRPRLLVCDEPVSALDVSIQAQIVNLLVDLRDELGLTCIFIAHDLSIVRWVADRVAVMYLGVVAELADVTRLYTDPKHPYTGALLSAAPVPDPDLADRRRRVLLQGEPPSAADPPPGCRFSPRCPKAQPLCTEAVPALEMKDALGAAACHFPLS